MARRLARCSMMMRQTDGAKESKRNSPHNAVRLSSFALSLSKGEWASTSSARTANRTVLTHLTCDQAYLPEAIAIAYTSIYSPSDLLGRAE